MFPVNHVKNEVIHHYLAFMDEQPVGAGTIICVEDVASIWNLCTVDAYRRRGVASALITRMLCQAREDYCQTVMLYSTAQAFQLFNRFGFDIYTQRQWFLPPGIDYGDD
jgi:N-acetylglutamate synthase-like GNAT family acetyltransferase